MRKVPPVPPVVGVVGVLAYAYATDLTLPRNGSRNAGDLTVVKAADLTDLTDLTLLTPAWTVPPSASAR